MKYYTKNTTTKRLILQPNYITTAAGTTVNPSAAQWAAIGAYPRADDPVPTPQEGKVAVLDDYEVRDGAWHALWRFEDAPPAVIFVSKARVESVVDRMGLTSAFTAWLNSKAAYIGAWLRGGDSIAYDPADNAGDLASLIAALGIPQGQVALLIGEVKEG